MGTDRRTFAVISLWGKFGGLHACAATFVYIVPLPNIFLTRLFSKLRLKRKGFQEILRLPWAQEAPGSNPGAPAKNISRVFFSLLKAPFTPTPSVEFWQTGGLYSQVDADWLTAAWDQNAYNYVTGPAAAVVEECEPQTACGH